MSAYIVHDDTIHLLVSAWDYFRQPKFSGGRLSLGFVGSDHWGDAFLERVEARGELEALGQTLLDENVRSVNHRYGEATPSPLYRFVPVDLDSAAKASGVPLPPLVLKSVACLKYQSCETPDHESSRAWAFLDLLERLTIRSLEGYEEAPFGWRSGR